MPRRIRNITKMKATQHRVIGKAILPGTSKANTSRAFILLNGTGTAKQKLDQLDFIPPLT
jgi:hypothetical protein